MLDKTQVPAQEYLRAEQAQKVIEFLDTIDANEVFKDDESKLEFLKSIDSEEFLDLLVKINNLLRNKNFRGNIPDGERVYFSGGFANDAHNFPKHSDKFELFREMFDRAKEMKNTKEIGALMAGTITGIHLFLDGNGRTSRLTHYLMSEPYSGDKKQKEQIAKLLDEFGRENIEIHPGFIDYEIEQLIQADLGCSAEEKIIGGIRDLSHRPAIFSAECPRDDLGKIKTVFDDEEAWGFYAVYSFLKSNDRLDNYLLHFYDEKTGELVRSRIDGNKVASDLSVPEIQDIVKRYYDLKADFIRKFIDIIASDPEKYPMPDGSDGTIKEKFFKKIKIDYEAE